MSMTNAIASVKAGIKSAERAGDHAGVQVLRAHLATMEASLATMNKTERNFQQNIRPAMVAKWAKNMDFSPR